MEKLYGRWLPTCYMDAAESAQKRATCALDTVTGDVQKRLQNRLKELLVPQTGGDSPAYSSDGSRGQENMYDDDDNPIFTSEKQCERARE
jgi:hypothetical protein